MNKKSGKAGSPVEPMASAIAHEADVAEPGSVSEIKAQQLQTQTGKYGSTKSKPFKPPTEESAQDNKSENGNAAGASNEPKEEEKKQVWIEIELVGEDDKPLAGEKYRVTLPDNTVDEGTLDQNGWARVEGFEEGACKITFPDLDQDAWEFIKSTGTKKEKTDA
jgi:hypothetical protein